MLAPMLMVRRCGPTRVVGRWSLLVAVLMVSGCAGLGYYSQAVWGGLDLLIGRRSVAALLKEPGITDELRARLRVAAAARDFATDELGLPDNKSYRRYKDLGRTYATWTVVVAPELSLEPKVWCFPVAGCVSYRGYFSRRDADRFAARMSARGFDVDVGGVRAYSTLGWFADPLLNTFVELPEDELVALLFHELAHQRLYLKGDTVFNESFATAVELEGVRRWLEIEQDRARRVAWEVSKQRELRVVEMVTGYRSRLEEVYAGDRPVEWKRQQKARLLDSLRGDYRELRDSWQDVDEYDPWFSEGLNNARLVSLGAYYDLLPAFCALLSRCEGSLQCFYGEAAQIAELRPPQRTAALETTLRQASSYALCGLAEVPHTKAN